MSQCKAVTKATATRHRSASKGAKVVILDELGATTGRHRDHARKALQEALGPRRVPVPLQGSTSDLRRGRDGGAAQGVGGDGRPGGQGRWRRGSWRSTWSATRAVTRGEFAQTLTVTNVFTGWTETKAVRNKAQKWVFAALVALRSAFPFPVLGIDLDNGSEFINNHLLAYWEQEELTFKLHVTRSPRRTDRRRIRCRPGAG